jgi:hypothetical protein
MEAIPKEAGAETLAERTYFIGDRHCKPRTLDPRRDATRAASTGEAFWPALGSRP